MRLNLEALQKVVKNAILEERLAEALRSEVTRALGTVVLVEGRLEQVAEQANARIDVLERTGRASAVKFKPAVMVKLLEHSNPEVRKLAVRTVPERFLASVLTDKHPTVRAAVAKRVPVSVVKEMLKRNPNDDALRVIYSEKRISEAGLAKPKVQDEEFDMYGEDRLGDSVKQHDGPELSDQWYETKAFKLLQDYGGNIEYNWEERACKNLVDHTKATSGVEIDGAKLLKKLKELIEDREERALERSPLKETLDWLRSDEMNEAVLPVVFAEVHDPVSELLEANLPSSEYVKKASEVFNIKESTLPPGIRKHRLGETNAKSTNIPVVGMLPHDRGFRALDERALDAYCKAWNDRQQMSGEPLRLEWSTHPDTVGKISFNVTLR